MTAARYEKKIIRKLRDLNAGEAASISTSFEEKLSERAYRTFGVSMGITIFQY